MIDAAVDARSQTVLAHTGAVALYGSLRESSFSYGEGKGDGVKFKDFLEILAQLPMK